MSTRIRRYLASDEGFSVAEVTVVMFLMGIVSAIVMSNMDTFVRVTSVTQAKSYALNDTRTALEQITKQVRAANPIDALAAGVPISTYDTTLSFSVYCSTVGANACDASHSRQVSFSVQNNTLTWTNGDISGPLLNAVAPAAVPMAERRGAVVNAASQPVFRYYDRYGQALSTVAGSAPPSTSFRDCVKSVEVHLVVVVQNHRPDQTIDLSTRVDLRNFNEVSGC